MNIITLNNKKKLLYEHDWLNKNHEHYKDYEYYEFFENSEFCDHY